MALRLTRRVNEVLLIGKDIKITVSEIRGYQVTLDIEAPRDIPIHRQEIADRIAAGVPYNPYEDR